MDKKKANLLAKLALLIVAILWGSSLTVVKQSSKTFNPNFILAIRFTLAAILLSIIFWKRLRQAKYDDIKNGLLIGIFLFMAYSSQTLGVKFADPGRSGFLSASYCVIVPFLGWIVFKQRPDRYNLSAAALCITGIFFISLSGSSSHVDNPLAWLGDLLALLSGLLFASHIIAVSALARDRDPIVMTILQFIMAAVLSWITTIVVEDNSNLVVTSRSVMELLYLAVMCTAVALLLQNIGQKYTNPSTAAIILGFESIFGILIPVLIGIESLTVFSVIGFVFIFAAILVSETKLSFLKKKEITAQ
ncbi:MAG: DMT family transporter [Finegoldia magna]|uniref:DMT family transporter n=1 Tax=Finegoldia magna TaxID=1260 RepID=UPI00290079B0|nr:DMT family transporter [Finegoldia magna]MDU7926066.1 DMT family transporter [Finegoldia magna]